MITPARGYQPPPDHPNGADILRRVVGTDPGLALKTRKGTGFYKIPSLRGIWYRPHLLHDGSLTSLEEMFRRGAPQSRLRYKTGMEPAGA